MEDKILSLIYSYTPSQEAIEVLSRVPTVLVVGISGAGKDTVIPLLHDVGKYHRIITHTTRPPRPYEVNDVHYHFINRETSLSMLEQRKYIEANYYSKNIYGTSITEFEKAAEEQAVAIADIDVNGVKHFMHIAPKSVRPVFLIPPSYEVWLERWRRRYGDSYDDHKDDLKLRLATAIDELKSALKADYYFFVINDNLEQAVQEVNEIAQTGIQPPAQRDNGRRVTQEILADMERAERL